MIILCADDFGQNADISQGILQLAANKRLSAISCMTQMPAWPIFSQALGDIKKDNPHLQTGVHFNLTHLTHQSLSYWMLSSLSRFINKQTIYTLINQQCDAFESAMGCAPDFIDGHQHVHVFPIIRDVIIEVITTRYAHKLPWVRNLRPIGATQLCNIKQNILMLMSMGFESLLMNHGIPHNQYFAGIYNLSAKTNTTEHFKKLITYWFNTLTRSAGTSFQALIMCHPGLWSNDRSDPIAHTRFIEYQVLSSDWFYNNYGQFISKP